MDQSIQLGDGGWGVLLQFQAFQRVATRTSAYVFGSYLLSPRDTTEVTTPTGVHLSVPDVYTARAGLAYALSDGAGLSVNLGGRLDGIPLRDLIGGDAGFRRPGFIFYLDPGDRGATWRRRVHAERADQAPAGLSPEPDRSGDESNPGGGDLADVLVFAGYTHRF